MFLLIFAMSGCERPPATALRADAALADAVGETTSDAPGANLVELPAPELQRMAVATTALPPAHWQSELHGIATVIDPQPLFQLISEQSIAEAARHASAANMKRIEALYAIGGNASQQERENFQSQLSQDTARSTAVRRQLQQQWGDRFTAADAQALTDAIASGQRALVRIEMSAAIDHPLSWAKGEVRFAGLAAPVAIESAWIAPTANLTRPGPVWLALVRTPVRLSVDARGQASAAQASDQGDGVVVPRAALVYAGDATWAYVDLGAGRFQRRPLDVTRPLDAGYFVGSGFAENERVVTAGAGLLLAAENGHDSDEDD